MFPAALDFSKPIKVSVGGSEYQVAALYSVCTGRFGHRVACAPVTSGIATQIRDRWVDLAWDTVLLAVNHKSGFVNGPNLPMADVLSPDTEDVASDDSSGSELSSLTASSTDAQGGQDVFSDASSV